MQFLATFCSRLDFCDFKVKLNVYYELKWWMLKQPMFFIGTSSFDLSNRLVGGAHNMFEKSSNKKRLILVAK